MPGEGDTLKALIQNGFAQIDARLDSVETELRGVRSAQQQHGQSIALGEQRCAMHQVQMDRRDKRLSEITRSLGHQEVTGQILIGRATATWKTLVVIAGAIVGAVGLTATIMQLIRR